MNKLFGPLRFIDSNCFLCKDGSLALGLSLRGIDFGCATNGMLEGQSHAITNALKVFDENFTIHQYVIRRAGATIPNQSSYGDARIDAAVHTRNRYLESRGLYSIDLYWVVSYRAGGLLGVKNLRTFSRKKAGSQASSSLQRSRAALVSGVSSFLEETRESLGGQLLSGDETFRLLRSIVNLDQRVADCLPKMPQGRIDSLLMDQSIEVNRDGTLKIGGRPVAVLSMKEAPSRSVPNLLSELYGLKTNFVLCSTFGVVPRHEAMAKVLRAKGHHHGAKGFKNMASLLRKAVSGLTSGNAAVMEAPDKASDANVDELSELERAIEGGDALGQYSTTIILHAESADANEAAVAACSRVFGQYESSVFRETYNALSA